MTTENARNESSAVPARIRVAFLLPMFTGGGAERVMVNFANAMPQDRFQSHLIVLSSKGPLRRTVMGHVRVHDLGVPRARFAMPALLALLRRLRPSALVVSAPHLIIPLLLARKVLPTSTRLIIREANLPSLYVENVRHQRIYRWSHDRLYRRADLIVATSERMRHELVPSAAFSDQVKVVPNPVNVDGIRNRAQPIRRLPGPGRRLVAAGRLVPQKGFDRLLRVIADAGIAATLTILGEGPERVALTELTRTLELQNTVHFAGFVDNPWAWMAGADALLLPSRTEGLPNVVLEALACGTPVIATPQSGGIGEIAGQAPVGAVTVTTIDGFPEAVGMLRPYPTDDLRISLLPPQYQAELAVESLAGLLES